MKCKDKKTAMDVKAEKEYPGAAVDRADCDNASAAEVKERTKALNNNRNNDQSSTD